VCPNRTKTKEDKLTNFQSATFWHVSPTCDAPNTTISAVTGQAGVGACCVDPLAPVAVAAAAEAQRGVKQEATK